MFGRHEKEKLENWIETEYNSKCMHLSDGKAKDYADYRERVGYIKALKRVGYQITALENNTQIETKPEDL